LGSKAPYSYAGHKIKLTIFEYINYLENEIGVGEIMLQSVDQEGTWNGFDYDLISKVTSQSKLPLIASGGCGSSNDLKKVLYESNAYAASIGSMAVYSKKGMGVLINFPTRNSIIIENEF